MKWAGAFLNDIEVFQRHQVMVHHDNAQMLFFYNSTFVVIVSFFSIASAFSTEGWRVHSICMTFILISTLELAGDYWIWNNRMEWAPHGVLATFFKTYSFCFVVGILKTPDAPIVLFWAFYVLLPLLFIIPRMPTFFVQMVSLLFFLAASMCLKEPNIARGDLICGMGFLLLSLVSAECIRALRINYMASISKHEQIERELKETEKNLFLQKKRTDIALRSTNLSVWLYDVKRDTCVEMDAGIERLNAHNNGTLQYHDLISQDYLYPESVKECEALYEQARQGCPKVTKLLHFRLEKADFEWQRVTVTTLFDENGEPDTAVAVGEDVTEEMHIREKYEQGIRYSNQYHDSRMISAFLLNLTTGTVEQWGDAVLEAYPTDYGKLIQVIAARVQACDRETFQTLFSLPHMRQLLRQGQQELHYDYAYLGDKDNVGFCRCSVRFVRDPLTGQPIGLFSVLDITEEVTGKRIMDTLTEREYDFLGLFDAGHEMFTFYNSKERESRYFEEKNIPYAQLVSNSDETVVPEDQERVKQLLQVSNVRKHLEQENVYFVTYSIRAENGGVLHKKLQYCYLDHFKQKIVVYRSDITQLYLQEQKQMKQLEQALNEARQANRAKTDFLSRISHDLRTPMNAILGLSGLGLESQTLEEALDSLNKINSSGQYLLSLINDTLEVNKIESNRVELKPQLLSNTQWLEGIGSAARLLADQKGVRFLTERPKESFDVRVDAIRTKQIFVNLLSNAIKFTPTGGTVWFIANILSRDEHTVQYQFIVRDTGIGMSESFLRNMYEPFTQESSQVSTQYVGSGLGLTIVKKLTDLMGGHIEVKSKPGQGTEFAVFLDLEWTESGPAEQSIDEPMQSDEVFQNKHILLCEDHPLNQEIAQRLLRKKGMRVTTVPDGAQGVHAFEHNPAHTFDVVLMDIRMPVMDGLTAAKAIRALPRPDAKKIPIIAMTANAYDEDREQTRQAGMNAHLTKPIDARLLYQTLAPFLAETGAK